MARAKSRDSARCAISVLATTISPLVSLSRRWTMPGRRTPPIPARLVAAMRDQRVDQGAVGIARGRVNNQAGGLVDDDQMCILKADIERDRLGRRRRIVGSGRITTKLCPERTRSEGSRSGMSRCSTWPPSISRLSRVRDNAGKRSASIRSRRCPTSVSPARTSTIRISAVPGSAVTAVPRRRASIHGRPRN